MSTSTHRSAGYTAIELLVTIALVGALAAVSLPFSMNMVDDYRLSGNAHDLSNATALAKMSASAQFTRARLYIDLRTNRYHVDIWRKTGTPGWQADGGVTLLSSGNTFGAGAIAVPPPNTQAAVAQPPACRDDAGTAIANTACIIFNSRGLSVDDAGAPAALKVVYLNGPTAVYAVVVSSTARQQLWRVSPEGQSWVQR